MLEQITPRCPKCRQVLIHPDECLQCGSIIQRASAVIPVLVYSAIILGVAGVGMWMLLQHFFGNPLYIFGKQRLLKLYEVSRPASEFIVSREPPPSLKVEEYLWLRELFETQQFTTLNEKIDGCQKAFAARPELEYLALDSFEVFQVTQQSYEALFSAWIAGTPRHYAPYLARASYYFAKGYESRGYKFAKDTSREQFEGMHFFFGQALSDIQAALSLQSDLMPAYALLISIHSASGDKSDKAAVIRRAVQLFPRSFVIHARAMRTLEPRWGGSYPEMEKFAEQAEPQFKTNPRLTALYGFIYYDQARILGAQEKHQDSVQLLARAMDYGDHFRFYHERAERYHFHLKDRAQALQDVNRSIALRPTSSESYLLRSRIYFALERLDDSLADLRMAVRLSPADKSNQKWMEWASNNLVNRGHQAFKQDLDQALRWYAHALEFNAESSDAYYWRAVANQRRNRLDLSRSMSIGPLNSPRHFEAYRLTAPVGNISACSPS